MNKKILIWILGLILLTSFVSASLIDSSTGATSATNYGSAMNGIRAGHSFIASQTYILTYLSVPMKQNGDLESPVTAWIYADDGTGKPTGNPLANSTTNYSVLSTSFTEYNFSFPTGASLTNGNSYVWIIGGKTAQGADDFAFQYQSGSGNGIAWGDGTTWSEGGTAFDLNFKTYDNVINTDSVLIDLKNPLNDTYTYNTTNDFTFNVTSNVNITNCSLLINGIVNKTSATYSLPNFNFSDSFTQTLSENNYNWSIQCTDEDNTKFDATNTYLFTIDSTDPIISADFTNDILFRSLLTGQFNFSDDNLIHSLNISIDSSINVYSNESINNPTFNYTLSQDIASLSPGKHILSVRVADGHTAKKLKAPKSYNPSNCFFNDCIKYSLRSPYQDLTLKMRRKDGSLFDNWKLIKKKDRFSEVYYPRIPSATQTFTIKSDKYIQIVEDSNGKYGGKWLIIGEHWKDFVLKNETNTKLSFNRISDNEVEVTITGIKNTHRLEFQSTGDLNIVKQNYTFYKYNFTETFENPAYNNLATNLNLNVDFGELNFSILGIIPEANLDFNGTNYSATLDDFDKYSANFSKSFTLGYSQADRNITHKWYFRMTPNIPDWENTSYINQTFKDQTKNLSFTFKDEESLEIINSTPVNIELIGDLYTYNDSTPTGVLNLSLFYPEDYTMRYFATGYEERLYHFSLSNATEEKVTLYLLDTASTTDVTATVYDEIGSTLPNVLIKVLKYDIATNSYIQVETATTNFEGQTIIRLTLNNEFYKFILEYPSGTVRQITNPSYILSDTISFQIQTGDEIAGTFYDSEKVTHNLAFNENSYNFRLDYSDDSAISSQVCLEVFKNGDYYNSSCSSSPSGTILVGITNTSGLYLANAIMIVDSERYFLESETFVIEDLNPNPKLALFLLILLSLLFAFVGFWELSIALILVPLPLVVGSFLGFIGISFGVMLSVEAIFVILAFIVSRGR